MMPRPFVVWLIGDRQFTVEGPYIARVPAGVTHAFMNAGSNPFHLLAVFPTPHPAYIHIGDNPLIVPTQQLSGPVSSKK
jgi:hypothetical protein